ncbi:hypothetical protein QBC37DRAFT_391926 [Rhypophila decipiens]|uniref:Uncharacterized protein n=1 Tax=Rhypophila decipiens TaxID=261697 RepID=A0AAN6Y3C0_9PEZI|nr:hypothetical protein QBC37DRAFT_391926 [Rhypophila decipiens]
MRYQDWDVILYPEGGGSRVPSKEFQVTCHAVPETEPSLVRRHGPVKIPVMHCYIPLEAGVPFKVSLHSWSVPEISDLAKQSYPEHAELAKDLFRIQVRILIDGQEVKSLGFEADSGWPKSIPDTEANDQSTARELELLRFPLFRPHLVGRQSAPRDSFGRIQIIISEGFQREMPGDPVQRFQNLVVFSFQYLPLELLENQGIAWPNPAMWNGAGAVVPAAEVPAARIEPFPAYRDPFAPGLGLGWSIPADSVPGQSQFDEFSVPQQDQTQMHFTGASYEEDPMDLLNFQPISHTTGTTGDFLGTGQFTFGPGTSQDYATDLGGTLHHQPDQPDDALAAADSPMQAFYGTGFESGYDFGFQVDDAAAGLFGSDGFDAPSGFDFGYTDDGDGFGGSLQQDESSGYAGFGGDDTAGIHGAPLQEISSNVGARSSMGPPARVAGVKRARTCEEEDDEE